MKTIVAVIIASTAGALNPTGDRYVKKLYLRLKDQLLSDSDSYDHRYGYIRSYDRYLKYLETEYKYDDKNKNENKKLADLFSRFFYDEIPKKILDDISEDMSKDIGLLKIAVYLLRAINRANVLQAKIKKYINVANDCLQKAIYEHLSMVPKSSLPSYDMYMIRVSKPLAMAARKPIRINVSFDVSEETCLYPVWFGTTRKRTHDKDSAKGFSNQRDDIDIVHYGKCFVSIPKTHRFGEVGRSWFRRWMKLDFADDRLRLEKIVPYSAADNFWSDLQKEFVKNEGDALVFLHGYNNSFEESAIRAAQIGFDLKVSGVTAFFSWPSKSEVAGYLADEASIDASEIAITEFLLDFTQKSGASKVHLIAHSMGNRGLIRALKNIQSKVGNSAVPFGQIILAAPDLDVQVFKNLAYLYPMLSKRTTLYLSPKDKAVAASKWLHSYSRVGIAPPITIVKDVDTINVKIEGFDILELGHSYFAEAESILHDMFDLLRHDSQPSERQRLRMQKTSAGDVYWLMLS